MLCVLSGVISFIIPSSYLHSLISRSGIYAPLVFMLIATIIYIALPLSSTLLALIGYFAFGRNVIIFIYFSLLASSIIDYYLAKKWGREVISPIISKKNFEKIESYLQKYEYKMLFVTRFLLPELFVSISYLSGLTSMRFFPYFFITTFSSITPAIGQYILLGKVQNPFIFVGISYAYMTASTIIFLVALSVYKLAKR